MYSRWMSVVVVLGSFLLSGGLADRGLASGPLDGPNSTQPAYNPWKFEVVDEGDYHEFLESGLSIAFDQDTNRPFVSYYDGTNRELRLAARSPSSSSHCTPTSDWACEAVDTEWEVGQNSSLAIFNAPAFTKYGIAYHDETNLTVKVAIQTCMPLFGCGPWEISTVDDLRVHTEARPSLRFDSHGTPCLSYHQQDSVFDQFDIKYAYYVGSGGNCGEGDASGKWECDDDLGTASAYDIVDTSLAFTSDDHPIVAYLNHRDDGDTLELCQIHVGHLWDCQTIDDISNKSAHVSLALDQNDHAHIAYSSKGTGGLLKLRYAHYVGSGGNCGANGDYQCDTIVDDIGHDDGLLALTLDESDRPVIAYDSAGLMIARPLAAYNTMLGNCGPRMGLLRTWKCTGIDSVGAGYFVGRDTLAIDTDRNGLLAVAYSVSDGGSYSLVKVARQYYAAYLPLIMR